MTGTAERMEMAPTIPEVIGKEEFQAYLVNAGVDLDEMSRIAEAEERKRSRDTFTHSVHAGYLATRNVEVVPNPALWRVSNAAIDGAMGGLALHGARAADDVVAFLNS